MNRCAKVTALVVVLMFALIVGKNSLQASAIIDASRNSAGSASSALRFSDVTGKDWNLVQVRINGTDSGFDRSQLPMDNSRALFTVRFEANRVGGIAAPNTFGGPYTTAGNQAITIGMMVSTMMAPLFEPEKLQEQEYYTYLQNAYKWNIADGKLELYAKSGDGAEVLLVFTLAGQA